MASYTKVSRHIPSQRRSARIIDVAVGDQVDIVDVLGRPARGMKLVMTDASDVAEFKLNNLQMIRKFNETEADEMIPFWNQSDSFSTFRVTGALEHETADKLLVSSIQIESLALSAGVVIELIVW